MKPFDQYMGESGRQSELDAIRAIPGEYERAVAIYNSQGGNYAPGGGMMDPVEMKLKSIQDAVLEATNRRVEGEEKWSKYMEENPFNFDEELARASAEEQYDPYYSSELRDYMTGVNRARGRTVQDEEVLRKELTASTDSYVGRARRELEQAMESSREGFAGAGLYFSGKRLRREGQIGIEKEQDISDYERRSGLREDESRLRQGRTLEDLALGESTYRRRWNADRTTSIETGIEQRRLEEARKRQHEAAQYAGGDIARDYLQNNPLLM